MNDELTSSLSDDTDFDEEESLNPIAVDGDDLDEEESIYSGDEQESW